jgi:peptidoglycan/xylan/chitin deacetylase (PgdA/CDA1 family)
MAILTRKLPEFLLYPFPEITWRKSGNRKSVYLTFDDGPDPVTTPEILQILKQHDVSATFFLLGNNIWEHRQKLNQFHFEKHGLANHGYHHVPYVNRRANWYVNEIFATDQLLQRYFQKSSRWFRPPYGIWGPGLRRKLVSAGKTMVLWTLMTNDFKWESSRVYQHIIENLRAGDIMVFHDNSKSIENVRQVLPKLIEFCKSRQLTLQKLPED